MWGAPFDALFNGSLQLSHLKLLSSVKQSSLISDFSHLHSSTTTSYFTDPSPANPHRRITATQCFTCQPPTSFSAFFTEIRRYSLHLSCLYIWFVGNSKVFRIFYIESRIGDEKFASLFFFFSFFFFVWCLGKHLIWSIETCGYGFSTHGEHVLLCFWFFFFFLCLMFG